jgi:dTDP-D-glucose 4,6-dehydratase
VQVIQTDNGAEFQSAFHYHVLDAGVGHRSSRHSKSYGLDISVTRCSNNYGPYHFPEMRGCVPLENLRQSLGNSHGVTARSTRDYQASAPSPLAALMWSASTPSPTENCRM